ncbi:MAG: phosphotransferase [Anaerolineae bacterium]|nr:phosphotransferase [Anaerolineae bacterium]
MQIPEYFLHQAARQFGAAGPGWVQSLPTLLTRCQAQWQLTDCVPADKLSINLLCYARSAIYGDVVLKIEGPHNERYTEITALRLYAGRHACKYFAVDEEIAAVLLERIVPGHDLRTVPDKQAQLEIGAELIAELPIPVGETHGFPHYADWVRDAIATTHARYAPNARMIRLMDKAETIFHDICPPTIPRVLLHGDLHHENMLQNHTGEWKAIDPQGVIGAPFMESARFIENHAIVTDTLSMEDLDAAVTHFAERLHTPKPTIARATYILHVLSTCWGYEMNYDEQTINQQIEECERLLTYLSTEV